MHVLDGRYGRVITTVLASVLSFGLGAATGGVSSYVSVRADAASLTERVTSLEQRVTEWRASDDAATRSLSDQINKAVEVLTDLRIRLGPGPSPVKP